MRTKLSPATTGETAKGRSISAVSSALPGKLKRAIAHAADMPNTRFAATAIGTTVRVSFIAWNVSLFAKRLSM
ncbi:MAG: hypothetical protein R3B51_08600 [Thermodesulfobacteriota bacterium]